MAEVEDVLPAAGLAHAVINASLNRLRGAEQQAGIDIALNTDVLWQTCQGFGHVHGPIQRNDVNTCVGHPLDHAGTAGDVEDEGGVGVRLLDQIHHLFLIGRSKGVVVRRAQLTSPRIKHLHHLGAGINLITQVIGDRLCEVVEQLVQDLGFAEGHGLDHRVVLAALALHHVGSQGPGGTNESEDSCFVANALAETTQHLTHKRH